MRIIQLRGPVPFAAGLALQQALVRACRRGQDSVLLLQHAPTYTAGRREAGFAQREGPALQRATDAQVLDVATGGAETGGALMIRDE